MEIYKGYKFRIYPNDNQKVLINGWLGSTRFVYNYFLNKNKQYYEEEQLYLNASAMKKQLLSLEEENIFLKEVDSLALRKSIDNLDSAYQNFFAGRSDYPKFKSKGVHDTYTTICVRGKYKDKQYENIRIDLEKREIILPKLKSIPIRGYRKLRNINGRILSATVSKEGNKYYVSLCVCEDIKIPKQEVLTRFVGIDLGVKTLATLSDGITYNTLEISRIEKKIKGLQKWLSRCKKGSKNWRKVRLKLQNAYRKLRNMRKYYLHSVSRDIVNNNDVIVCEKLHVKDMLEKGTHTLSRKISNGSFGELLRQLEYKCKWNGKKFYQIDPYYPSSQICSVCEYQNKEVKDLSIRKWECPKCHYVHDRDVNASINIMWEGIKMYMKEVNVN